MSGQKLVKGPAGMKMVNPFSSQPTRPRGSASPRSSSDLSLEQDRVGLAGKSPGTLFPPFAVPHSTVLVWMVLASRFGPTFRRTGLECIQG